MNLNGLFNIKGLVYSALGGAVLSAAVAVPVTMWATSMPYKLEIANLEKAAKEKEAADVSASLKQLQDFIANMSTAAKEHETAQGALVAKVNLSLKSLADAIKNNPLPPGCLPDAARVRALFEAVNAANSAAKGSPAGSKPSPAVP